MRLLGARNEKPVVYDVEPKGTCQKSELPETDTKGRIAKAYASTIKRGQQEGRLVHGVDNCKEDGCCPPFKRLSKVRHIKYKTIQIKETTNKKKRIRALRNGTRETHVLQRSA